MDLQAAQQFINTLWDDSIIPTLHDYIRIPNKSPAFDPDWAEHGHMQEAVELFRRRDSVVGVAVPDTRHDGLDGCISFGGICWER